MIEMSHTATKVILVIYSAHVYAYALQSCRRIFMTALFVIVYNWKQMKYFLSVQINRLHIYTTMLCNNEYERIVSACICAVVSHKNNVEQKKPDTKEYLVYDSNL